MASSSLSSDAFEDGIIKCTICSREITDGLLLQCLHSACMSCSTCDSTPGVTCSVCQVTTDKTTLKPNLLISSLSRRSLVLKNAVFCKPCIDNNDYCVTVAWCCDCQHSLCKDCQKCPSSSHSAHKVMYLDEHTKVSQLYHPVPRLCQSHDKDLKYVCFTCKEGRCDHCACECNASSHDILPLDSPDAHTLMQDIAMQVRTGCCHMNTVSARLETHFSILETLCNTQEKSLEIMMKKKQLTMDMVSDAYKNASKALVECWDAFKIKSMRYRELAEVIKERIDWTQKYCDIALESNDIAGFLPQINAVQYSLTSLVEEVSHFTKPIDPSSLLNFNVCLSRDLESISSIFLGLPNVVRDDFNCSLNGYPEQENVEYYSRKALALEELENLIQSQRKKQEVHYRERQETEKLQSEFIIMKQQLATSQNEVKQLQDQKQEQQEQLGRSHVTIEQLQSELKSKSEQLATSENEVKELYDEKQEQQGKLELNRVTIEQLQSELKSKAQKLAATENEVAKLFDAHNDHLKQCELRRSTVEQLQSDLMSKKQELVAAQNEVKKLSDQLNEQQEQRERERRTSVRLQSELKKTKEELVVSQNEAKRLSDQLNKQQQQLEHERRTSVQLQSEIKTTKEQLVTKQDEVKKLSGEQKDQQEQRERDRQTLVQLQSELKTAKEQLAAPTKPLSFNSRAHGTFKGPGRCFDVAVTPHGSLLVAAMADGLKEYDIASFREMATWKPDSDLLGQQQFGSVRTVDVLSDGRVVVGLRPKLVVLLQRSIVSSSSAAAAWQVKRRLDELQAPPRRLSAWDDHLLAVLEDRWNESTKSWLPGPGLVLLSLCDDDGGKQLHSRQQLQYDALSVALTDRVVIVTSEDQVELSDAVSSRSCYVVDCFSHLGLRLWRHEVGGGLKVMSVCSDSVGRGLYAAKSRGSVVALSADDGRELSTAITLTTKETEETYAVALGRASQRLLALISLDDSGKANIITIFSAA